MNNQTAALIYPNGGNVKVKRFDELGTDILITALEAGKMRVLTDGKVAFICPDETDGMRAYVYSVGNGEDHFIRQYVNVDERKIIETVVYW